MAKESQHPSMPSNSGNSHSSDDLEMLREIISANKGLHSRVLDKIRMMRALSKDNVFDEAQKNQTAKKQDEKTAKDKG